jgi:predicted dienelactone hydrolase
MLALLLSLLPGAGGGAAARPAGEVGFETVAVRDGDETLRVGVWYPARGVPVAARLESFVQRVVAGGAVMGTRLPLVVMSHGGGGSLAGHVDTALALARAGFVVAAPDHAGDMRGDESKVLQLWRRPRQLSRVVTFMLSGWRGGGAIDARRIGAYGFSNGGFTVLVAAGAVPRLALIDPYCRAHRGDDLCRALAEGGVASVAELPVPADAWRRDARLRAVAAAAPGFAPAFDAAGLRTVRVPVQLWYGSDDRHQPGYGERVLAALPRRPELHVVTGAGHYTFLAPCPPPLARAVPAICRDAAGFDRAAFHRTLNAGLVRFFRATLAATGVRRAAPHRAPAHGRSGRAP